MKWHLLLILSLQLLTICNKGESAPTNSVGGPLLAGFLIAIVVAAYQFFIHFSEIKEYYKLYFGSDTHMSIAEGMRSFTISLAELNPIQEKAEIQPKDSPINIAFNNLSLTLKSVSIP